MFQCFKRTEEENKAPLNKIFASAIVKLIFSRQNGCNIGRNNNPINVKRINRNPSTCRPLSSETFHNYSSQMIFFEKCQTFHFFSTEDNGLWKRDSYLKVIIINTLWVEL